MPVAMIKTALDAERCWEAVRNRDRSQDGKWFVGVVTTGVYCRPSCPSRPALRKNVRFYATSQEAERDGLRPCLRCKPLDSPAADAIAAKVMDLCRYIDDHRDTPITLEDLAARAGLSR